MKINHKKRTICDDLNDALRKHESGEIIIDSIELTQDEWARLCVLMCWNGEMKDPRWKWCPLTIANGLEREKGGGT